MNRQHKYRGLTFGKREWVYGYYALIEGQGFIIHSDSRYLWQEDAYRIEGMTEVDPAMVGEFTGLRDSKRTKEFPDGQEIYEGDKVRIVSDYYDYISIVRRDEKTTSLISDYPPGSEFDFAPIGWVRDTVEDGGGMFFVIGSIHDAPEARK